MNSFQFNALNNQMYFDVIAFNFSFDILIENHLKMKNDDYLMTFVVNKNYLSEVLQITKLI